MKMKRLLYLKFLLGYLLFFVLGFLVIAFFSAHLTENYLLHSAGERLYNEACLLADACTPYGGTGANLNTVSPRIETVAGW